METPSNPQMEGNSEVIFDGMSEEGHRTQVNRTGGQGSSSEERAEGDTRRDSKKEEEDEYED